MFSIYHSAFNLIKHGFVGWETSVKNSCKFADEVIIAVNTSSDGTKEAIEETLQDFSNWKIVETDFSYQDPWLDGKIKNTALQTCTQDFKIQLDLDEYIPLWQKPLWENLAMQIALSPVQCAAVASVNLYKDWNHYSSITNKQYFHKGQAHRAPSIAARKPDGTINTKMSDGCDLVNADGQFVSTTATTNNLQSLELGVSPFVVHFGYVDLDSRLKRNHEFWHEHWYVEGGGQDPAHTIHMKHEDFEYPYLEHKLKL
jgi:hypothetical protein